MSAFLSCFNPHTHTGCDPIFVTFSLADKSFNPHTHTGCDCFVVGSIPPDRVSIHTPIQGVTLLSYALLLNFFVSIHTPIQGVTPYTMHGFYPSPRFNPHTHTGCDARQAKKRLSTRSFNPHTHTGCDSDRSSPLPPSACFNPHTHTGCDYAYMWRFLACCRFQSTHPYRV